ncbi:FAD/FMN-containing dehydrogenase [Salisediminibacterium beveridgei]|uniref:FAD/FMN-containing dehydrogenase n=2 Tax=Salisediminibacterium beveridgei TaxID=632773 RepID=A0A1D7QYF4_9BACI|nr:FAD/FMN-containing dehydrogenase [Salisediminibacterium beveridgei]
MMKTQPNWERFEEEMGSTVITEEQETNKLSKDYYWYSPVLAAELADKVADGVAKPETVEQALAVLKACYTHDIPVTTRGAGTGNYGQGIPSYGGLVLDLSGLNKIIAMEPGQVTVQAGVKLGRLEKELREAGSELCIYPSTYMKATVGGFFSGGSGGIGSIAWGNVWDGNLLEAHILTMEEEPRILTVKGDELNRYIHNYGTSGIMVQLTIRTAEAVDWEQVIVQFDEGEDMLAFTESLAYDDEIRKRLVSGHETPIPTYFVPLAPYIEEGKAVALIEIEAGDDSRLKELSSSHHGQITRVIPADRYHKEMSLSDFTWNHTTLWALKTDPTLTYLQSGFSTHHYLDQMRNIKQRYPDEVHLHVEWVRGDGDIQIGSLPVIEYQSRERLYEIIDYFESIGVSVNDPHTFLLPIDNKGRFEQILEAKALNDPKGLLNPGKLPELKKARQAG